ELQQLRELRSDERGRDPREREDREELEHLDGREVAHPALPHPARPPAAPAALDELLHDLRTADGVERGLAHRQDREEDDERELDEDQLEAVHYVFFPTF